MMPRHAIFFTWQRLIFAAIVLSVVPLVDAQTTYTWNGGTSSPTLDSNWNPAGGPPGETDHIRFDGTSSADMTFASIATFTAASWTFAHPSNTQTLNSSGTASQLISTGDLTVDVASNRSVVIRYGGTALSASIGGDIKIDSGQLMFGSGFTSTTNGRFGDLLVGGSTTIADETTLSFGNMVGDVELGDVVMSGGTMNVLIGSTVDGVSRGSLTGGTNLITMTRLHGNGTIRGNKSNPTELTTGHLLINGSVDGTFSGTIIDGLENNQLRLTKGGSGTLTLSGENTYSGGTILQGGILIVEHAAALGNAGGAVAVTGSSETVLRIAEGVTVGNSIAFSNSHANSAIERIVASAGSFSSGTSATLSSDFDGGNTVAARFLGGASTSGTTLQMGFTVSSAALNDDIRISDVFFLSGTGSDIFALELSMDAISQYVFLGWLDSNNAWVNAVAGNSALGEDAVEGFLGSFDQAGVTATSQYLGSWGVDVDGGNVWAVLDHNSAFAVIPEPRIAALAFALLALLTSVFIKRRR